MDTLRRWLAAAAMLALGALPAAAQTVSGLPPATQPLNDADLLLVVQQGKAKQSPVGALTSEIIGHFMDVSASNATLPTALINLKVPWFFVEAYRLPTDSAGDDTALVQRVCNTAMAVNGAVVPASKQYNIRTITLGVDGQRVKCDLIAPAWNGDVGQDTFTGGTLFKQLPGTNASMFVVPKTAPPVEFRNLWLDGNKDNNTCTGDTAIIEFPDNDTGVKARSANFHNIRMQDACNYGVFIGTQRNAGILDHVTISGSAVDNVLLNSAADWRATNSDFGGAGRYAFYCNAGNTYTSTATNYFSSTVNIRIGEGCGDVQFTDGSVDRAGTNGLEIFGTSSTVRNLSRIFKGVHFTANSQDADNTYDDIKLIGEKNAAFIAPMFIRGTLPNRAKFNIETDSDTLIKLVAPVYRTESTLQPYGTAFLDDWGHVISAPYPICRDFHSHAHTGDTSETVLTTCLLTRQFSIGQRLNLISAWHFTGSANNKIIRARFGAAGAGLAGTLVAQQTINGAAAIAVRCTTEIFARSNSDQVVGSVACASGTTGASNVAPSVDLTADAEVAFTVENANAGDTSTLDAYSGTVFP